MTSRLEQLQKFLEEDPVDAFTHYAIAMEYASQGKYEEALAKLEEVLALDPSYIPAYHQLGLLYAQHDRKSDAQRILNRGIGIAEKAGEVHARGEMEELLDSLGD